MGQDWKDDLATFFEDLVIIRHSQQESRGQFDQFCEFIAEPAFEELAEEFKSYKIKTKIRKKKTESIAFQVNFPKSRIENLRYVIYLPKNALELKMRLLTRGRITKKSPLETKDDLFMADVPPGRILKLTKEDLIRNVLENYQHFNYEATTRTKTKPGS